MCPRLEKMLRYFGFESRNREGTAPAFSSVSVEGNICFVIDCEGYSSLEKLLHVTGYIFCEEICSKFEGESWKRWMFKGRIDNCRNELRKLIYC